jgi:outer membrane protein assembly factor BamB
MRFLLLLLVLTLLLGGCSWFGGDDSEPPAELVEFEKSLKVYEEWYTDAGVGSGKYFIKLQPYYEDDRIFTVDVEGNVEATGLARGKTLWKQRFKTAVSGGIAGGEGILVFGTESGEVIALDQEDGRELWRNTVSSEVMAIAPVTLGIVVVRTNDGNLFGLNADSGSKRWQAGRKTPALSLRGVSAPLVTQGVVLAGFDNGKLIALNQFQGMAAWEASVAVPRGRSELERMVDIDGVFAEKDGVIYVATYQGRLAALSGRNGRVIWSRDMSSFMGLTVDGNMLYLSDDYSNVWAIDRNSGATLWKQPALRLRTITAPAVLNRYVVVADYQGYLHWMDKYEGHFVARVRSDEDGVISDPLVIGDRLVILGKSGELTSWKLDQ